MHDLIIKSKEIKQEGGGEFAKSGTKFWRKEKKKYYRKERKILVPYNYTMKNLKL